MLQLISMEIDETLGISPAETMPVFKGGPRAGRRSQIHVSLICFPVSAASLLSSPLLSGDVWLLGGTTLLMMMMMLSQVSATVKTC